MVSKVIAKEVFDSTDLQLLKENIGYKIVCNECRVSNLPENVEIVNADIYRIEGTWEAYRYNDSITKGLLEKSGNDFNIFGYDVSRSISKFAYWTNFKVGSIKYCLNSNFKDVEIEDHTAYFHDGRLKAGIKYFRHVVKNNLKHLKGNGKSIEKAPKAQIGILVNDEFELILYKFVIDGLRNHQLIVFHYGNIDFKNTGINFKDVSLYNLSSIQTSPPQGLININRLKKDELNLANIIYSEWQNIGTELKRYEAILQSGIGKLLINVGENLPLRNLMKVVFGSDVAVYNTMNGMKSGEAHDSDINFDRWFTWDQEMNNLLVAKCRIPQNKLISIGHLSEDHIRHHSFGSSFKLDEEIVRTKKIISVFSVRGNRSEKLDAFRLLYEILEKNEDYFLIVKPHPLEKISDYRYPDSDIHNLIFVGEDLKNHKPSLYDILMMSDLCIVFGSTVALESKWIQTPCITFEYRNESMVHDVDGKDIIHINNVEILKSHILNTKKKDLREAAVDQPFVSDRLVDALLEDLLN